MKLRVLHCPTSTGGQAWHLSRAERKLGIESDVLVLMSNTFEYPSDINLNLSRSNFVTTTFSKIKTFFDVVDRYDVFHFNFGASLIDFPYMGLNHLDLAILKHRNKKIFFTYQGCDGRIRSYCLKNYKMSFCHKSKHWHCSWAGDWVKFNRIKRVCKYADQIFVLNPDLLPNIPGALLEFYVSINPFEIEPPLFNKNPERLRIVHAPSVPEKKGTRIVQQVVARLDREGYPVELDLVMGQPHAEAMKRYAKADIVVDQLFGGWYGVFAVEAMLLGKPVLCYLREEDLEKFVPFRDELPIVNTSEKTLYDDLKNLIQNPKLRYELGVKSRVYVGKYHDPNVIAKRMLTYYVA